MRDKVEIRIHSAQVFSASDSLRCDGVQFDAVQFDVEQYSVDGQKSEGTTFSFSFKSLIDHSATIIQFVSRFFDSRIKIETPFAVIEVKQKADFREGSRPDDSALAVLPRRSRHQSSQIGK